MTGEYVDAPGNAIWSQSSPDLLPRWGIQGIQSIQGMQSMHPSMHPSHSCFDLENSLSLRLFLELMVWIDQTCDLHWFTMRYFSLHTEWRAHIGFLTRWKQPSACNAEPVQDHSRSSCPRWQPANYYLLEKSQSFPLLPWWFPAFLTFVKGHPQWHKSQVMET